MVNFYTVVGTDNMVKLSNWTNDPNFPIQEGERLLLDAPPAYTSSQKVIRIEPVPTNATEIPYTVVTDEEAISLQAKLDRKATPLQFIERFTDAEQLAIVTMTQTSPQIKLWYDKLLAANEIDFDDTRTQKGMASLVALGLITQERSYAILPPYVV